MNVKNTTHVDRVNRIKQMIKDKDVNLPSWIKLFNNEYKVADEELREEYAEERKRKVNSLFS